MSEVAIPVVLAPVVGEELSDEPIETPDKSNWRKFAECLQTNPDAFFPKNEDTEGGKAKSICGRCAVDSFCLQIAIDNNEEFGIWGGLTAREIQGLKSRPRRR